MSPSIVFVAIVGAVLLAALPFSAKAYFRFRGARIVRCPRTGLGAQIELDHWHAAATAFPGPPGMHVARCSLWPEHEHCGEVCVAAAQPR